MRSLPSPLGGRLNSRSYVGSPTQPRLQGPPSWARQRRQTAIPFLPIWLACKAPSSSGQHARWSSPSPRMLASAGSATAPNNGLGRYNLSRAVRWTALLHQPPGGPEAEPGFVLARIARWHRGGARHRRSWGPHSRGGRGRRVQLVQDVTLCWRQMICVCYAESTAIRYYSHKK